jgi:hypothetical protein
MLLIGCSAGHQVITLDEYNQVSDGMSYSQVVSIVGEDGKENSSSTMPGVPGYTEAIITKAYSWQNADGSNMICMFQNDRLISKAQAGL